ncbi:MAG: protein kinase domain-containing protein, partial [Blastocatellia bacterium]
MDSAKWKAVKNAYSAVAELGRDERSSFLFGLSDDIKIEVEKLMAADPEAAGFISKPFLVELGAVSGDIGIDLSGNQIDDYVLLKTIGAGGMGTVYLAERKGEGFSQKVAVKLIKRGMDTNAVLKRFLMERQILANLEHPFIARMLDGGSTPDGLPYFVMEHVDGEPIRSYCDNQGLETTSRLELFSKVCTAVMYAHQNLVVHRDLKPSNILINEEGDPKLLDFGIAKLLSPDWNTSTEAATATQFRILTPEYASPEQLRGEPTTTATDVYSLGVVLYELLTGQRPFSFAGKNPSEIADAILTQEPQRPSTVVVSVNGANTFEPKETTNENNRRTGDGNMHAATRHSVSNPKTLRGDLDNIVLKAIRRDPERRYQSVQEFNNDIDCYLRGLPVKATADSKVYRFGKFVKRHRTGVFASASTGLVLLFATGVTGWQYVEARREKAKAEMRFNEVRKLANSIIFDHYEKIKDLPGTTEAKEKLIADAVNYLDSVSSENIGDPEHQRELVQAYQKLAEIKGMTKGTGDLGDRAGSFDYYQKALMIQENLVASDPSNVQDQRRLASLLADISYLSMGKLPDSDEYKDRSFRIYKTLRTLNPDREQAESDYARAVWDRANTVRSKGDNAEAIKSFSEAASIYENLYNGGAGNKKYR